VSGVGVEGCDECAARAFLGDGGGFADFMCTDILRREDMQRDWAYFGYVGNFPHFQHSGRLLGAFETCKGKKQHKSRRANLALILKPQ